MPLLAALVLALTRPSAEGAAHAQTAVPPGFELNWSAPSGCPDKASLRAQVAKLAPNPAPRGRPLRVEGAVRAGPDGFELVLVLRDGEFEGRRRFESGACAEVVGAAAVTIALLLSSGSAEATAEPAGDRRDAGGTDAAGTEQSDAPGRDNAPRAGDGDRQRAHETPRQDSATAALERAGPRGRPADRRWRLLLAAPTVSAGFGLLPDPSFGLGAGVGVEFDGWRLLTSGVWNFDSSVRLASASDQGADVSRVSVRLAACRWFGAARWQIAPCATFALTYLVAHGVGSGVAAQEADSAWLALGPGLLGGFWVTEWMRLAASAGFEVQTARPVLVIDGLGKVEQIETLELVSQVGAEWIF